MDYEKREFKKWEDESPLYSETIGRYFYDEDEIEDYCCYHNIKASSLVFRLCEPLQKSLLDPDDFFYECLSDEKDFNSSASNKLKEAVLALNKAIEEELP